DVLLWGDSHMLAWAPGFDAALKRVGRAAFLVTNSGCPPIVSVSQPTAPSCLSLNDRTMRFTLETEPSLVILTARWELWLEDSRVDLLAMDGTPIPADQKRE